MSIDKNIESLIKKYKSNVEKFENELYIIKCPTDYQRNWYSQIIKSNVDFVRDLQELIDIIDYKNHEFYIEKYENLLKIIEDNRRYHIRYGKLTKISRTLYNDLINLNIEILEDLISINK